MAAHAYGAFIEVEPSSSHIQDGSSIPVAPQKAYPKVYHSVPTPDEIKNLQFDSRLNGLANPVSESGEPTDTQTPQSVDLEMSRPATPVEEDPDGVYVMQSFSNPPMNRYRMTSVCLLNFANGLSDAAPGALIPYMEK